MAPCALAIFKLVLRSELKGKMMPYFLYYTLLLVHTWGIIIDSYILKCVRPLWHDCKWRRENRKYHSYHFSLKPPPSRHGHR
jgi:hypothetical protein